jgi:hypothetical protein
MNTTWEVIIQTNICVYAIDDGQWFAHFHWLAAKLVRTIKTWVWIPETTWHLPHRRVYTKTLNLFRRLLRYVVCGFFFLCSSVLFRFGWWFYCWHILISGATVFFFMIPVMLQEVQTIYNALLQKMNCRRSVACICV